MKVRISTIIPFIFMLSLYVASISSFLKADAIDKAEIAQCNRLLGSFVCYHCCNSNLNNWHYISIALLVAAFGFTFGLFMWIYKNYNDEAPEDDTP